MIDFSYREERIPRLADGDFSRLSRFIYQQCGIHLPASKRTMLEARLQKRLRTLGMGSFRAYCDLVMNDSENCSELLHMIDVVTTNKTDFFREADHFAFLRQEVVPRWLQQETGSVSRPFRLWSAGCSTGEEPYTLAMVMADCAAAGGPDFRILATDISTRVLEKGFTAIYDEARTAAIPAVLKKKYLLRSKDRGASLVRIVPELRERVQFRRLNLMEDDFPVRELQDVIFCRNVVIYFDRPTQEKLLQRLCRHLHPRGHLFMGHSESLSGLQVPLTAVYPTVYRKSA